MQFAQYNALHVLSVCYLIGSHTCFPLSFFDTFFNFRGSIFDCSYELYSFQEEQQVQDLVGFQEVTTPYFPLSEKLSGALEGAVHLLTEGRGEKEVPPASRKRDLLKRINKKVPEVSRVRPLSQICSYEDPLTIAKSSNIGLVNAAASFQKLLLPGTSLEGKYL